MLFSTLLTCAALARLSIAGYVLEDDYSGDNFFDMFDFFTGQDPTHGFVDYVDQGTASSGNLISTNNGAVYMGVDHTNQAPNGRSSVRITSKKSYDSGLVILDLAHMPQGCGTWPAFWMVGPSWPNNGEIDILEGVNEQTTNAMTLHTGPGCSITNGGGFSGSITTSNCDVNAQGQSANAGCQIMDDSTVSYGAGLNNNKGGVYATQWTSSAINIYFFPRGSIPSDITNGSPDPSGWGMPTASFKGACDIASTFRQQQIVFDTTFCGDWAGNVWSSGSCASKASTCNSYVANNPSAFQNAYWSINALKVYQEGAPKTSERSSISSSVSSAAFPSIILPTTDLSLPFSLPIPSTTFAISRKSATESESVPFPFPTFNATGSGLFPTGTGVFATGTGTAAPFPFPNQNSTNGTFPTATQVTFYTTVTITDVVTDDITSTVTPTPLMFSAFGHQQHAPPSVRSEKEREERANRRKRAHLQELKGKRHGSGGL